MSREPLESRREVSEAVHETCRNFDALRAAALKLAAKVHAIPFSGAGNPKGEQLRRERLTAAKIQATEVKHLAGGE